MPDQQRKKGTYRRVDAAQIRPVSKAAQLVDVYTVGLSAEAKGPLHSVAQRDLDQLVRVWAVRQKDTPRNGVAVVVRAEQEVSVAGETAATVSAKVLVVYALDEESPDFTDTQLDLFAEVNGVFNAWPYLRELLGSTSLRLGLQAAPLPSWKPQSVLPPRNVPWELRRNNAVPDELTVRE